MTKNNDCLCRFDFTGIPPAPKGVPVIEVTFDIDCDNTLVITVAEEMGRGKKVITIDWNKETLSREAENYKMCLFKPQSDSKGKPSTNRTAKRPKVETVGELIDLM